MPLHGNGVQGVSSIVGSREAAWSWELTVQGAGQVLDKYLS